jgi:ribosomal protein S8E
MSKHRGGKAFTAKVIELKGNPKNPESAQHIIKFPGGSIEVSRTTEGNYWAHIEVNRNPPSADGGGVRESARGRVAESRVSYEGASAVSSIPDHGEITHMAVLVEIEE